MRGKDRSKQSKSEDETVEWFRLGDALNLGTEPKKQCRPKDQHDERSAGAGEVEERRRKDGQDRGEEGDVVLEPTIK